MMQPSMRELKERAKREQELREKRNQTPFQQDGFFESTNYQIPDNPPPVSSGE